MTFSWHRPDSNKVNEGDFNCENSCGTDGDPSAGHQFASSIAGD